MKISNYVFNLLLGAIVFVGCKNAEQKRQEKKIDWQPILNTNKPVDFFQIDSVASGYIVSYCHSAAISGGFKIIKLIKQDQVFSKKTLFEHINHTVYWVKIKNSEIGFIRYDFDDNTARSTLLLSKDLGKQWDSLQTPVETVRRFEFLPSGFIVEGTLGGTTHLYKFIKDEVRWQEIAFLKKGFLYFNLLKTWSGTEVLCDVSRRFDQKNNKLVLFDVKGESIEELADLYGANTYLAPICRDNLFHTTVNGKGVKVYLYKNGSMHLDNKFKIPAGTDVVRNLYINGRFYIITCDKEGIEGKAYSWISYDKGENWSSYNHENQFKLVYNTFGGLFMVDSNNDLLAGG